MLSSMGTCRIFFQGVTLYPPKSWRHF